MYALMCVTDVSSLFLFNDILASSVKVQDALGAVSPSLRSRATIPMF